MKLIPWFNRWTTLFQTPNGDSPLWSALKMFCELEGPSNQNLQLAENRFMCCCTVSLLKLQSRTSFTFTNCRQCNVSPSRVLRNTAGTCSDIYCHKGYLVRFIHVFKKAWMALLSHAQAPCWSYSFFCFYFLFPFRTFRARLRWSTDLFQPPGGTLPTHAVKPKSKRLSAKTFSIAMFLSELVSVL